MKILFWGTPEFALPSLRALVGEGHDVVAVVTQPDRPAGRGRKLRPSPVKELAQEEAIPLLTPERPSGETFLSAIRALEPELSVVVAYGHILKPEVLDVPRRGSVNAHGSLLPELRGAAPVHWAIARGHMRTGVTIMEMTEGMDEGPILLQRELPIGTDDTGSGLSLRLAELGAEALVEALTLMEAGALEARPQEHDRATYAPKVDRRMARIEWSRSAGEVGSHVRAMDMVPGAWTLFGEAPVKLFSPRVGREGGRSDAEPGTVLEADPEDGIVVAAGEGHVAFHEVQPPGRRRMGSGDWLRGGGGPAPGDRFT